MRWPTCTAVETACRCRRRRFHRGAHRCECGGSWEWVDGEFVVHELPPGPQTMLGIAYEALMLDLGPLAELATELLAAPDPGYDVAYDEDGQPIPVVRPRSGRMAGG